MARRRINVPKEWLKGPVPATGEESSETGDRVFGHNLWICDTVADLPTPSDMHAGEEGIDGDWAFVRTNQIFHRTTGSWVEFIGGSAGPQGIQGIPGFPGDPGDEGTPGIPGPVGPTGLTGDIGPQGVEGIPGATGDEGESFFLPGPTGPTGADGTPGTQGPAGIPGFQGDDGEVGSIGPPGLTGATGSTGAPGPQGIAGIPGPQGDEGDVGSSGPPGPGGSAGPTGDPGPQGSAGVPGFPGDEGEQGQVGPPGRIGVDGAAGATGPQGPAVPWPGPEGDDGAAFPMPGPKGDTGAPGGGGGGSATTVEVNLGAAPALLWQGKFTITDAAILSTSKILVWQAPGPYTGKGARGDEAALAPVKITHVEPATGSAVAHWRSVESHNPRIYQPQEFRNVASVNVNRGDTFAAQREAREVVVRGKIRGNIKFSYMILA